MKRITAIDIETAATLTIRWRAESDPMQRGEIRCPRCGSPTAILAPGAAGSAIEAALRQLGGEVAERIHLAQTDSGLRVVCLDSLQQAVPQLPQTTTFPIHHHKENPK
jgi:hypothetical protein